MLPVTIFHAPAGRDAIEVTPVINTVRFDSAAVGGFGSLEASFVGDVRRRFGYLGVTRVMWGTVVLWEGQLEDVSVSLGGQAQTTIRCFGLKRLIDETTARRIWSKRDLTWREDPTIIGVSDGTRALTRTPASYSVTVGNYDASDLTVSGVQIRGIDGGGTPAAGACNGAIMLMPTGLSLTRVMYDYVNGVGGHEAILEYSADGTAWGNAAVDTAGSGSKSVDVSDRATRALRMIGANTLGSFGISSAYHVEFNNIRVLGTALVEDAAGGFYGGTVLRDLIALIPGLRVGVIDAGSDFTIQSIERAVRDTCRSVLDEVAGYYTREWAVWEDGRFDWRARNLDEPQWMIRLVDMESLDMQASVDGHARTVYVLYSDAASGMDGEQSASATDQRNPYVRQARTKDVTVQPGFPMTPNTAAQYAAIIAADIGARPPVTGTVRLKATTMISNAVGAPMPAAMIRGGDNVLLPDMPKTDPFRQGRDGETLFHIVSVDVDLTSGIVSLELEGQQTRQSVIAARLAAVTRVLTG